MGPGLLDAGYGLADKILPGKLIYFLPHNVPSFESLVRSGFRRASATTSTPSDGETWPDADASEPQAPAQAPLSDDVRSSVGTCGKTRPGAGQTALNRLVLVPWRSSRDAWTRPSPP